ncbi:S-adenosyl-L-methionine-dependent methyltransferase [Diaporthe sp. PMI_573]|nr:S-adenosyl-L-methionine-dependent methyltransferase [Diaporthaceae sp. PMI_573]
MTLSSDTVTKPSSLVSKTESWDESAVALLKTASEGPTTSLNKELLERVNRILPFSLATAILDTGCGVGQVLGRLIETYGASLPPTARLVAADLSPGMIAAVQGRQAAEVAAAAAAAAEGRGEDSKTAWARVEAAVCDAADLLGLAVEDGAFSHVTAGLLLLMVQRPGDVLAETRRVLQPGGVFGMTSFRSVGWMDIIGEALGAVRPGTGLGAIPEAWASTARVAASLEEAGFREVCVEEVQTFYEFTDPEAMTRFNVANIPSVKAVTAAMSGDEVEQAIQWMLKRLGERFPDGRGRLEGTAIVATGRK